MSRYLRFEDLSFEPQWPDEDEDVYEDEDDYDDEDDYEDEDDDEDEDKMARLRVRLQFDNGIEVVVFPIEKVNFRAGTIIG